MLAFHLITTVYSVTDCEQKSPSDLDLRRVNAFYAFRNSWDFGILNSTFRGNWIV